MKKEKLYPVIPLRDIVVFPGMVTPLFVGREKSLKAFESALKADKKILLVAQKESGLDDPKITDLYKIGVIGNIIQVLKLQDSTLKILIEGQQKVEVVKYVQNDVFVEAAFEHLENETIEGYDPKEVEALSRTMLERFEEYVKLNKKISPDIISAVSQIKDLSKLTDIISAHLIVKVPEKQTLLETLNMHEKMEKILIVLGKEIDLLNAETRIRTRVEKQVQENQSRYLLNEKLKAIHEELGTQDNNEETNDLEKKLKALKLTKETREKAESELKKLKMMNPMSSEAGIIRNYLEWIISLPWGSYSKKKKDLNEAQLILDGDHYGLDKVKERILEYLAVNIRADKIKGQILCLVGPPGVGKTSLAKSIAKATGRNFSKISLGGLRDEAEIRGHRRTYIGAMPGKIIQAMKKAKSCNPVILLDEIDKMSFDHRGDPASALLEVLDPEQNNEFNDHYLDVDYDLSNVMFIATANSLDIPRPLMDRMEVIRLSGYTEDEKMQIVKTHLLPKQEESHLLKKDEWQVNDETISEIIRYYTREAGVRNLDREIAKIARKVVKELMLNKEIKSIQITPSNIEKYLGVKKFSIGETEDRDLVGITNGLAYTEYGGDLLAIEAVLIPHGKGQVKITGKLGDVMKESIQAAASYIHSRGEDFGIKSDDFTKKDIHIHVPEGATPKDGPSAGVAMCTSIVSILTNIPVDKTVAMTGEITLRGRVLAIGGLKEKLLAALRANVKKVVIPKENVKDLADVPDVVKNKIEIIPVETVEEVLRVALTRFPKKLKWVDSLKLDSITSNQDDSTSSDTTILH